MSLLDIDRKITHESLEAIGFIRKDDGTDPRVKYPHYEKYIYSNISNLKNIEINEFKKCIVDDGKKYKLIQDKKMSKDDKKDIADKIKDSLEDIISSDSDKKRSAEKRKERDDKKAKTSGN